MLFRSVLPAVYAAGEPPVPGATAEAVAAAVRRRAALPVTVIAELDDVAGHVAATSRAGDVVLTLGAGSIAAVPQRILDARRRGAEPDAR